MSDLTITCSRCRAQVVHQCHGETFEEEAIDLFMWRPEGGFPKALKNNEYAKDDDRLDEEDCPFFSEAFLYALLGKEDARTLLSRIHSLFRAMGLEPGFFEEKAYEILIAKKRDREAEAARRAAAKLKWAEDMKPVDVVEEDGYLRATYGSFLCFDTNVGYCEDGRCLATRKDRTKPVKPQMGPVSTHLGGLVVQCLQCKRKHVATREQLEGWRGERGYQTTKHKPEDFLRADCIRARLAPPVAKEA